MWISLCTTFRAASQPTKHLSGVTFTAPGTSVLSFLSDSCSRSSNISPMATICTPGELLTQLTRSRVPCPPQPMMPTRIVSEPAAYVRPATPAAASEAADAGLRITTDDTPEPAFAISTAEGPQPGDSTVEQDGATVYLDGLSAQQLDDKVLDAQLDPSGNVQFALGQQA